MLLGRLSRWIGALALSSASLARAHETGNVAATPTAMQPDIALVLSGGGVRGLAHVGVLRALEEQCIPIDMIVGSEWGALVGGLYAAGLSPDEIESALLSPEWHEALQDRVPRQTLSFRAKQEDREFLVDLPLGLDEHGLILPQGLYVGSRLRLELARLTLGALGARNFEYLPIAFLALATDLESGEPITLDQGSLTLAIEASLSTPVLRAPVRWGERRLVSGEVAAPLPIDAALAAGARTLIVVDLGMTDPKQKSWNFFTVGARVLEAAGSRNAAQARARLRPGDIVCAPTIGDVDLSDAANGQKVVARGHAAALEFRERLAPLASKREEFAERLRLRRKQGRAQPIIERVLVDPNCALSERAVRARMNVRAGAPLDVATAEQDLARLYGLRIFQRVDFDLVPTPSGNRELVVHTEEMASAPLHWRSGLTAEVSAGDDIDFTIGAGVRWAPTDAWGSEARLLAEVGNRLRMLLDYRQALEPSGRWFLSPYASWEQRPVRLDTGNGAVTEYSVQEAELGLDLVREFGNDWEARAGIVRRAGDSSLESGAASQYGADDDFTETGMRFALTCDSLDDTGFPNSGSYLAAKWFLPIGRYSDGHDETLEVRGDHALSWDANSLVLGAEFDTVIGDTSSVQSLFPLGGFLRLSGLQADSLNGPTAALGRVVYRRALTPRGLENRAFDWHAGASAELGNVFAEPDDVELADLLLAGSIFVGVSTLIGPAYLGVGLADGGEASVFFVFGGAF